jgi:23S rRNA (adenine2503-C2)-methyltransferase
MPIQEGHQAGVSQERRGLLEVPSEELAAWLVAHQEPPLRARQLRRWLVVGRAESFERMTDLPRNLRRALAADFEPLSTQIAHHTKSSDGTHKLLLRLADGQSIECVLIQEDKRRTACISTQVGCGMGCVFCASGLSGVARNLTSGEILEQLIRLRNLLPTPSPFPSPPGGEGRVRGPGQRLTHIVVMGMGEPLANLDALVAALETAGAKDGLGIGARHVTISTVGLPAKIRRLADLGKQYHLAVSLHAPNEELRTRIVPTTEKTGLAEILAAADYFFERNGRQVTFEYVVLGGINDSVEQAKELGRLLRGQASSPGPLPRGERGRMRGRAHVNLIPYNDVAGLPYHPPAPAALSAFVNTLRSTGLSVKVRKRKGSTIDAACGQLRRRMGDQAGERQERLVYEPRT